MYNSDRVCGICHMFTSFRQYILLLLSVCKLLLIKAAFSVILSLVSIQTNLWLFSTDIRKLTGYYIFMVPESEPGKSWPVYITIVPFQNRAWRYDDKNLIMESCHDLIPVTIGQFGETVISWFSVFLFNAALCCRLLSWLTPYINQPASSSELVTCWFNSPGARPHDYCDTFL